MCTYKLWLNKYKFNQDLWIDRFWLNLMHL